MLTISNGGNLSVAFYYPVTLSVEINKDEADRIVSVSNSFIYKLWNNFAMNRRKQFFINIMQYT